MQLPPLHYLRYIGPILVALARLCISCRTDGVKGCRFWGPRHGTTTPIQRSVILQGSGGLDPFPNGAIFSNCGVISVLNYYLCPL